MRRRLQSWVRRGATPAVVFLAITLLGTPAALAAQAESAQAAPVPTQTLERTFTFLGGDLRVTITGTAAGTIRVIRGGLGQIDLAASATGAIPAAGFDPSGSRTEMTLDSGAASHVDYVLTVPTSTRVSVRRAGRPAATLSPLDRTATWSWPGQETAPPTPLP